MSGRGTLEAPLNIHPSSRPALLATALLTLGLAAAGFAAPAKAPASPKPAPAATPGPGKPASTRQALVIEGDDHLFMVSAPSGWVLDDTSGMGSRIRCVLYPKGQTWASAATVMYVNPLHGYGSRERTVSMLMADDQRAFLKRTPGGRVTDAGTLPTGGNGKTAQLRYFATQGGAPHEAVAYVPEKELVMLLVLSSKSPQGFQQALPAFRDLVSTYAWVGSNREFGR